MPFPNDIIEEIHRQFPNKIDKDEVVIILNSISRATINVGKDQLVRGILIISNGDLDKIKELISSNFYGDPRDLLMEAQAISSESNYGNNKFNSK